MATGGYDRSFDNRVTCSICLEPYRGRQPKILPCFHTFCLPCLTQIADKEVSQSLSSARVAVVSSGDSPVTITCPTCRTPITLPPAGVSALHNNLYVDGGDQESDPRPLLCDLCEEGKEAKLTCSSCKAYFCTRCRRTHDKLCKSNQVTEVNVEREAEGGSQGKEVELLKVAQMLGDTLQKLSEEVQQQRKAGVVSKMKDDQEQSFIVSDLMLDEMDAVSLTSAVKLLMQKQSDTGKLVSSLQGHVTTLQGSVTTLQNQNSLLFRDVTKLEDKKGKLEKEQEALQREVVSLKDKNAILCQANQQLRHEVTKLQADVCKALNDVSRLQDYTTTLQQLQDTLQGQTTKLESNPDIASLPAEVASLKADQGQLQGDMTSLKADQGKLEGEMISVKADQGNLQGEMTNLKSDQGTLQRKMTSVKADQGKLQGEMTILKADQGNLQGEMTTLKTEQGNLQREMTSVKTDNGRLKGDIGNLKSVQGQVKRDVWILSTQVFFQAILSSDVTLQNADTLICDDVSANVGGGYDGTTGVFTAPVSGVYCFMASSSPWSTDINSRGRVTIMLDEKISAYLFACGKGSSTAHVSLSVKNGQKVWLQSRYTNSKFSGNWITSFTGFLVQPDL